jgi:hypothetical protein
MCDQRWVSASRDKGSPPRGAALDDLYRLHAPATSDIDLCGQQSRLQQVRTRPSRADRDCRAPRWCDAGRGRAETVRWSIHQRTGPSVRLPRRVPAASTCQYQEGSADASKRDADPFWPRGGLHCRGMRASLAWIADRAPRMEVANVAHDGRDVTLVGTQLGAAYELRYRREPRVLSPELAGQRSLDVEIGGRRLLRKLRGKDQLRESSVWIGGPNLSTCVGRDPAVWPKPCSEHWPHG